MHGAPEAHLFSQRFWLQSAFALPDLAPFPREDLQDGFQPQVFMNKPLKTTMTIESPTLGVISWSPK